MAAVENLVTLHLDLWTTAIKRKSAAGRGSSSKIELYGIKKLRELILELAVRGLLAPQDPHDEPASELLKRIAAEKAKLVKEGKKRKDKPLPSLNDGDHPFDVPQGWVWARLGGIGTVASSSRVHQKDWQASGVPFFRTREIVLLSQLGFVDNELFISEELYKSFEKNSIVPEAGDLMFTGVGTIGVPYVVADSDKFYFKDASVLIFKNHFRIYPRFLYCFMRSPCWINAIHEDSMGTTVHTLTIVRANNVPVPLPPLAEQHRIVAKVDELMALCDQLGRQSDASVRAHQTLVETLLNALSSAAGHAQFARSWERIVEHFDTLFTTEESIDQLKQIVLQLAVMGKLVPQDPNDEPASELLKTIADEKAKLVEEGKVKADKPLPPLNDAEIPFELPKGWLWERLPNVALFQEGPGIMAKDFRDKGVPLIRISGMHGPVVSLDGCNFLDEEMVAKKWNHFRLDEDDIVLSSSASLGKVSKVKKDAIGSIVYTGLIRFKPFRSLYDEYLIRFLGSSEFERQIDGSKRGAAILHFGPTHLRGMILPVPPFAEQRRIVSKVNEVMALCNLLKVRLADAQTTQLHLADALVKQPLAEA